MNKSLLALLLGVCVVGMGLLMYQEKRENPRMATPASAAAAERPASVPALPVPQELSAVPSPPASGPTPPKAAGRPAATPTRTDALPAAQSRPLPKQEKKSDAVKAPEVKVGNVENAGAEKSPPAENPPATESSPVINKAPVVDKTPAVEKPRAEPAAPAAAPEPAVKAAEAPPQPAVNKSAKLVVFARDKGATVRLTSGNPVRYQSMTLTGPDRVVVDVEGISGLKAPGVPKNPLISSVRLGTMDGKTRIVIDLTDKPAHTRFVLSQEKDTLDIRVDR